MGRASRSPVPSKADFEDNEEEYIQVVRKSVVPIDELVECVSSLKKLETNEQWVLQDYRKAHLLDGIPDTFQGILVECFNTTAKQTHLFKPGLEHIYVPLIYRVCSKFVQISEVDISLAFFKQLDVINVIQNFNKTWIEVEPVLQSNFSGINKEEIIVDLFSQSYIHNFIELQSLLKTISSEL